MGTIILFLVGLRAAATGMRSHWDLVRVVVLCIAVFG
jgi:hypothetical protein